MQEKTRKNGVGVGAAYACGPQLQPLFKNSTQLNVMIHFNKIPKLLMLAACLFCNAHAASLTTTFKDTGLTNSNMFNVETRGESLKVTGFDIHEAAEHDFQLKAYMKLGGWEGFDTDLADWIAIGDVFVARAKPGESEVRFIDVPDFLLPASAKIGFYLMADWEFLRSTKADGVSPVAAANDDLLIYQGIGKIFDSNLQNQIWNGSIYYEHLTPTIPEPASLYLVGIAFAAMRLVRANTVGGGVRRIIGRI